MDRSFKNFFFLRHLRNANRMWFFDSSKISWLKHFRWWKRYWSADTRTNFFQIRVGKALAGFLSERNHGDMVYELGNLMLRKKFQGRGLMTIAVNSLTCYSPRLFFAEVKEDNSPSRDVFIRCGFKKVGHKFHPSGVILLWEKKGSAYDECREMQTSNME